MEQQEELILSEQAPTDKLLLLFRMADIRSNRSAMPFISSRDILFCNGSTILPAAYFMTGVRPMEQQEEFILSEQAPTDKLLLLFRKLT